MCACSWKRASGEERERERVSVCVCVREREWVREREMQSHKSFSETVWLMNWYDNSAANANTHGQMA